MTKPILSVGICMYNSCENVARTLQKLADQEQDGLEVIVLDDGSTESVHEVKTLCDKYHFRYLWQANQGEAGARQKVLDEAKGEFFTWVDADDSITDDYVETIFSELKPRDGYAAMPDIIFHKWLFIDGTMATDHEKPLTNWNVWSNVYRREAVKDVKFDLNRQIASDYFWLEEAYKRCGISYYSDKAVNIYNNKNPDSLTHRFERGEVKALFSEE